MNVERDEGGERFNPFSPASPKCWSRTNSQALRGDCELGWPGWEARVLPGCEAAGIVLLWGSTGRDCVQQVAVPPQVCWNIGARAFDCVVCPDVPHSKCKLEFFSQVSSSCTKNLCVSQLTATGRGKKKKNTQRRGVFPHLCPGKVAVTAAHDTLGFWQSSGWFCSADTGWSMLSVLPSAGMPAVSWITTEAALCL